MELQLLLHCSKVAVALSYPLLANRTAGDTELGWFPHPIRLACGNALDFLSQTTYVVTNKGLQVSGYCCSTSGQELGLGLPQTTADSRWERLLILACGSFRGRHNPREGGVFVAVPILLSAPLESSTQNNRPNSGWRHGNIIFLDSQKVFKNLTKLEELHVYLQI